MKQTYQSCIDLINLAISENYDGRSLSDKAVEDVMSLFNNETISTVLAHTIRSINYDGRISSQNKEWANSVLSNIDENLDILLDYTISSHAGLINIFTNEFRMEELKNIIIQNENEYDNKFKYDLKNTFAIYQLKNDKEYRNLRFRNTDELAEQNIKIDSDNYNILYADELKYTSNYLNNIYEEFNSNIPFEFLGHSLSSSDIIALKIDNNITYHYINSIGFKEINKSEFSPKTTFDKEVDKEVENFIMEDIQEELDKITTKYEVCRREQEFKGWNIDLHEGMCIAINDNEEIIASFDTLEEAKKELEKHTSKSEKLSSAWNYTLVTEYNITENRYDEENNWFSGGDVYAFSKFEADIEYPFIDERSDNIEIKEYYGTWYVIETEIIDKKEYYLLESEQHGDEVPSIIVDREKNIILEDVWNGFSDLYYKLENNYDSEHEIIDKDYFFIDKENKLVVWLSHNHDTEKGQFVKTSLEFDRLTDIYTRTSAPDEFFNVYYSDRGEQYIADIGTPLYDELKNLYESGTQDLEGISDETLTSLKTLTENINLYNQKMQNETEIEK